MREYNSQAFTPEEVEQGLLNDLLNYLLDYNKKCESGYYDIHITSDSYCTIVEWVDINYDFNGEEGKFQFVPSNGYVQLEYRFPDGHYEMFVSEEAYNEAFLVWRAEHPEWVESPYGTWTNVEEDKKWSEILEQNDHD